MLSYITFSARKSLYSHLRAYCINQIYKSRLKHQVTFYCTQSQKPEVNAFSDNALKKEAGKNEEGEISKFTQQEKRTKLDELNVEFMKESIEKLYPNAVADLNEVYDLVKLEYKKECISVTNQVEKNNRNRCTINVTWPSEKSFTAEAANKKSAAREAALSCLAWLYMNKRLRNKKPVLYNDKDIGRYLEGQEIVNVNVIPEWKREIQSLISNYNDRVKPVITAPPVIKIKEEEKEETNSFESNEDLEEVNEIRQKNNLLKNHVSRLRRRTEDLPISRCRQEILKTLADNQVVVIKGDTGCGKSTQVPQYIIDDYIEQGNGHACNIVIAEPRRISAVTLAHQVAWERNEKVGDVVGYHVRFDNMIPQSCGSILYCTTGVLLRRLEHDPSLKGMTHVIIDEAHERSLQTDVLLKYFRNLVKRNSHIKLVIMSASINAELFQNYFSCPVVDVPGKTYPVKMHFMEDIPIFNRDRHYYGRDMDIPYGKIVQLIKWITTNKPPGAILCFLPGWQEIKRMYLSLQESSLRNLYIMSLHSKIPINEQQKAFEPAPDNMTKVILSTDVAETGITIKDITYVIDTAIKRKIEFNEEKYLSSLNFSFISQANICQRKGRAGRVKPGESYHLISRKEYEKLDRYPTPEIFQIPLEEAIIISKGLTDENAKDFFGGMIETPSRITIDHALSNLKRLKILDDDEKLTSFGKRISHFALQPKLSRAVILSCIFQCLDPVLSIATVFSSAMGPSVSLDETMSVSTVYKDQKQLFHKTSDHIALLQYYDSLGNTKRGSLFDSLEGTQPEKRMNVVKRLYLLHMNNLISTGMISTSFDYKYTNVYAKNNELIRAILFAGTNHLIKRNAYGYKKGYFTGNMNEFVAENGEKVRLKTETVNCNRKTWPSEMLTYINKMEFVRRRSCLVTDTSIISPLTVLLFSQGDAYYEEADDASSKDILVCINNIENVKLCCEKETADLLLQFRDIIWNVTDFIIKYEGEDVNENNLSLVKSYKEKLMPLLSRMLLESSRDIDYDSDDVEDSIES